MSSTWHEMAGHLQRSWLGEDPVLKERLEKVSGSLPETETILSEYAREHAAAIAEVEVKALADTDNPWEKVLRRASGEDLSWLEAYGMSIREEERQLARFLYAYPADRCREIGEHIVEALLHGFISQSRDRRDRKLVRLNYCVGQEALAQAVLSSLEARGLRAIVQQPQCLTWGGAYAMAHSADRAACLSEEAFTALCAAYEEAFAAHAPALLDTCGMIGIGQFGEAAGVPKASGNTYVPDAGRRQRLLELENAKRELALLLQGGLPQSAGRGEFPIGV